MQTQLKAEELLLGDGWSTQEFYNDSGRRAFRWTSNGLTSLHVDTSLVRRLVVRCSLPVHVTDRQVHYVMDGAPAGEVMLPKPDETDLAFDFTHSADHPVVKLALRHGTFVPHKVVGNNDYRSLGMQVFSFEVHYRDGSRGKVSIHLVNSHAQYYAILAEDRNKVAGATSVRKDSYGALHLQFDPARRTGKINMNGVLSFVGHRYGWSFVLGLLNRFHGEEGVMMDGFIDSTFRWNHLIVPPVNERNLPYDRPWFGFMHNPVLRMPEWFTSHEMQPGSFLRSPVFNASLPMCKGLYVLAKPAAEFLSGALDVPVNHVYHPTGVPEKEHMFDFDRFLGEKRRNVVQVGWWCRRFRSLYELETGYRKVFIDPHINNKQSVASLRSIESNMQRYSLTTEQKRSVEHEAFMPDQEYDVLLSKSVVFLHLYDAIANNAIIECMARGTPVLVNPLPCVVDYLGEDYPLYFKTVKEASMKLGSDQLLREASDYLKQPHISGKVHPDRFIADIQQTEIFKTL